MTQRDERERELAEELERTRDDAGEWSSEPADIDMQAPATRSQVVSFRMPLEELENLTAIASASGESLSEFIRGAVELRIRHTVEPSVYVTHTATLMTVRRAPAASGRNEPDPFYVSELGSLARAAE